MLSGNTNGVAFSPDGSTFITGTARGDVQLWRTDDGRPLGLLYRQAAEVQAIEFSPDGSSLAIGHRDGSVRVCRPPQPHPRVQHLKLAGRRTGLALSPDGHFLLPTGGSWFFGDFQATQVWDARTCKPAGATIDPGGLLTHAAFSPNMKHIATLSIPGVLRIWDWRTGAEIGEPLKLPTEPRSVAYHPHADQLVVLCEGGEILSLKDGETLWESKHAPDLRARIRTDSAHHNYVVGRDRDFSPILNPNHYLRVTSDGKWVITCGLDNRVNVLDFSSGAPRYPALQHHGIVRNIALSSDERLLAVGTSEGIARVWHLETGKPACEPLAHPLTVLSVCFNSDASLLLTAGDDGTLRVWDWQQETLASPAINHGYSVMQAVFLNADRWILSTGEDHTVRCWSRSTGHPLAPAVPINGLGYK